MKTRSPMTGRSGLQMGGSTRLFQFLVCVERTIEHILVVLVFRVHFAAPRVLSRCLRSRCSVHIVAGRGGWGVLLHPEVPSRLDCLVFRGYRSPASDLDSQAPPQHRHIPRQSSLGRAATAPPHRKAVVVGPRRHSTATSQGSRRWGLSGNQGMPI